MSQETINTERLEKSTQPSTASSQETVSLRPQSSFFSPQISLRPSYGPGNKNVSSKSSTSAASTSAASSTSSSMSSGSDSTKASTHQKPRNTSSSSSWDKSEDNAPSQSGVTDPSKFQYDRNFMLKFQSLSDVPDTLAMVFVDWPELQKGKGSDEDGKKGQVKKRSGSTSGSKSSPGLQRRASNAYTPRPSFLKDEKDSLLRNLQGTLNKITPENFERLAASLTQMFGEIADDQTYSDAVGLVFDKALSEPNFSRMYAELCVELNKFTPKWADVDEKKPPYYFRRNLLNKCQEEFEKQTKEIPLPEDPEERAIAKDKRKRRKLGNVKFIGELFKHKSVSEKIIIECFSGLFSDIARYKKEGDKEMLESTSELLCKLLATTGKLLESKAKAQLDGYINEIKKYSNDEAFSSRMRFFFQEMGALRAHDWKPRREENVPKTITQIHAEALAKEFEDEVQAMVMTKPPIRSSPQVTTKQVQAQPQGSLKITVVKPAKQTEKAPQKQAPQQSSTLSLETLEQKLTDIVEEYLASLDAKNAVSSMMDVRSPIAFSKFVEIGILNVLDKREKDRESLSKLFTSLSQHGLLKPEHMLTGLSPVLELVDDLEIDIPGCSKFVGKFVGLAVASNILPASYVDSINKPDIKTTALQYVNVANQ